jgi:HEPN domain-containing protein
MSARYDLDVEPVAYAVRDNRAEWAGRLLRDWVPDLVAVIVDRFDPAKIVLFGSVSDGTDGPDSDIDLLVVLDHAALPDRRRLMVDLRRATRDIAAPHDLLVSSVEGFARNQNSPVRPSSSQRVNASWCMSDQRPEADPTHQQRWLRLAEEDLVAAHVLVREGSAALRIAGFLAQQAAEKALKAGLFAANLPAPRIHGLRQLHASYPDDRSPDIEIDDLDRLDPWVIDGRYAADLP